MKKIKLILAVVFITASAGIISCNESSGIKDDEKEEIKLDLAETKSTKESEIVAVERDYIAFKLETDRILAENEARMLELKLKMMNLNADTRTRFQKDLDAINAENEKLRKNIQSFKSSTEDNWTSFKKTVNNDIDKLGKSISALAEVNEKKN